MKKDHEFHNRLKRADMLIWKHKWTIPTFVWSYLVIRIYDNKFYDVVLTCDRGMRIERINITETQYMNPKYWGIISQLR